MPMWRPRWYTEPIVPGDLTVILLTLNKPPKHWQAFHRQVLLESIGDMPLVIVSKEPMDWGRPNTLYARQDEPGVTQGERIHNIYTQLLKATNMATTPYIATVDDDSLYPKEHFTSYRPPLNKFAYNYCRWITHEWIRTNPFYYHSPNPDNAMFVAPREKLLGHMAGVEYFSGPTTQWMLDCVAFYTLDPVLCFHHTKGLVGEAVKRWKRPWPVRAYSIPRWGLASDIIQEWREED